MARFARTVLYVALSLFWGYWWMVPTAASAQRVSAEKVSAALPKLEAAVRKLVDDGEVPGISIAIVFQDNVVFLRGFGFREERKPDPVDADTVFQLASLSKAISSAIVAAIVGDGAAAWDSRIVDIDPAFQLSEAYPTEQVTIRDLLSHRSGLPGAAGNELESLGYDREEILYRLRYVAPASSLRAGYSYSNFGFTEGAVAAAKAAGMAWEDAAEQKLYKPLGMTSTSSRHADFLSRTNRAALHARFDGKWQALSKRQPDAQAPAGGVSSNARDLAQWMRLELRNGAYDGTSLIEEEVIEQTHKPLIYRGVHPVSKAPSFYGLGWNIVYGRYGTVWGHAGAFSSGASTVVNLLPSQELGIVVLANAFPTGVPEAVADTFFDLVFTGAVSDDWLTKWNRLVVGMFEPAREAAKAEYASPPESPSPALPTAAYVGTYANDYIGNAIVEEAGTGLALRLGPNGEKTFPLTHFDRDLFLYYPNDEMPDFPIAVTFRIGPDQTAAEIMIDDLNDLGFGVLRRQVR